MIDQVLRQRDEGDRAAVTALARGRNGIQAGLDHFLSTGAVRLEPEVLADPVAALAAAYWEDPEPRDDDPGDDGPDGRTRIALAFSNRDVDRLNEAIRAVAVSKGIVNDAEAIEVRVARERRVRIAGGARVWRQDAKIRVGEGDRVLLTRPAPELGLPRSGFGTVTKVADGRITVLVDGREEPAMIDPAAFPHLDHGFAATIHKAQGMTADLVSVLPHARMDGHATYVALSRHRDRVTVYGRRRHLESAEDLHRMGVRIAAPPIPKTERGRPAIQMPENATTNRQDWQGARRSTDGRPLPGLAGDAHLQSVALRVAGLLSADRAEGDPVLKDASAGRDDFTAAPQDAIDTLVARHGVIRAEELAGALAAPVADPETFLRLFDEAIRHPDLVALPGGAASKEGDAWVYSTAGHVRAELAAVDRAMRMAARSKAAESGPLPEPTEPLSTSQREALAHTMQAGAESGGLALVTGGPSYGKTRLAAEIARTHEAAGRVVTVIAATAAGRSALEATGVNARTLDQFLGEPPVRREEGDPGHVIVLDDAHAFGAFQADAVLARAEATGAGVVAILDPSRRPQLGGAVFRALADRTGTAALEGVQGTEGLLAETAAGLGAGGEDATAALAALRERGHVEAAGGREAAISHVAAAFANDPAADRIALAWSRADADALTDAIRHALDETMPERRVAEGRRRHGPLADLRPGDRLRFTVAGWCGTASQNDRQGMILRGDRAEVLETLPGGGLRMRVSGLGWTREVDVVPEGPLPPWRFAFASTIAAAAGSRHDSVHLLASPGLDRATLAAGAVTARQALRTTLPVAEEWAGATLDRIAGRERPARSAADHGFDPALAARAAAESAVPVPVRPRALAPEDAATDSDSGTPAVPPDVARANRDYLRVHPEHVLALVQADTPVFTETDVRQALRARLGASMPAPELAELGDQVMRSDLLVTLATEAPDGAPQYVTTARAETMRRAHATARKLAAGRFAPGAMPVARDDLFRDLNPGQARAAESMLGPERLTLVQGHAGTGKTHTLRAVAAAWQARGVEVLAGAPSGKAVTELAAIDGVQTGTLARWEARWQMGDVPKEGAFVFVVDEAGMVGAGAGARIQERVRAMGGKLIAVGDPDQLQPVSDMPWWAIAERAAGHGHVSVIDHVVRQADPLDAEATRSLALGGANVGHAVGHYQGKGALRLEGEVRADPVAAAARAHVDDMEANAEGTRMSLAYTNRDVWALNAAVRADALSRGVIDPETVRRYGAVRRRVRGEDGQELVTLAPRDLGVGDRIVLTRASEALGLPKSSFGTVIATQEHGLEVLFDGREEAVALDRTALDFVDHGHASTIHKSQGMTADAVFVLPHRLMHRHATYVALSRHSERLAVFGRAGHLDRPADLVRMGQAAGTLDTDLADGEPGGSTDADAGAAPWEVPAGLEGRADWRAQGAAAGRAGFVGDARFMAVAERVTGLMAVGDDRDPDEDSDRDPEGLASEPGKAVDVLLRRASVFRDEDVAGLIANVSRRDPDTFLRFFREAMSRPDLVVLAEDDGRGGRVWTTAAQLETEVSAVDRGIRLALGPAPAAAPAPLRLAPDFGRGRGLSPEQEAAVRLTTRGGRLRLVSGDAGSGKTAVAAIVADVHERAGRQVVAVAPTGAGVDGLREAGLRWRRPDAERRGGMKLLTLPGLERELDEGRVTLDPNAVIVLDDAGRIGADLAARLLERVEESGAKLVAFLDDGVLAPPEAGPVFRALGTRLGAARLDETFRWEPRRAIVMGGLMRGGEEAENAVAALAEDGCLVAARDKRRAVAEIARAWVADGSWNRVALAWSHRDVDALNAAIAKRLDREDPARREHEPDSNGPFKGLRPGDRIRFTVSMPRGSGAPVGRRFLSGELAEYRGRDQGGRTVLKVRGRDGAMRDVTLPKGADVPDWRLGFAGTIAGETGRPADSVHMLASPGMSRQLLATGARLHRQDLRIVIPAAEDDLRRTMSRIVARDATPESVLDHGFDPALGAREAMRGRAREIVPKPPRGISAAVARLREIARLGDAGLSDEPLRGLEGEVMAEIVGASILRHGEPPTGRDRLALEAHVAALADPREWRGMLRQSPSGTVREADALAADLAGTVPGDGSGRAPTAARILARGALTARALGEDVVADLFEDGLRLYGRRASLARALGRPEDLVADQATEKEVRAERAREAMDRGAASGAGSPLDAPGMRRPRRRSRGLDVTRMLDELDTSDERLAEEAFGIFLPKARKRRSARRHHPRFERCADVLRLGGNWPERAEAVKAAREEMAAAAAERAPETETAAAKAVPKETVPSAARTVGPGRASPAPQERAGADPDLVLQLAMAVTARTPMAAPVHAQDLQRGIASLLERADAGSGNGNLVTRLATLEVRNDAERELVAAIGEAAAARPLPDIGPLRAGRSDLLAELASTGVSPEPQPDLGERMAQCFTQAEILALHDARRPLPESLPKLGRDVRRDVALHLQTFAPLDDPTQRPEPDPLPVMGSILACPDARETFIELARSLSLDQLQALREPDGDVPEGLGGLGRGGRKRIAEAFRTGPAPGREDTAPDPRFADDVLVLSCAVSERVDAAAPVHRGTLPLDVEKVLKTSALVRSVPGAEVDEVAFGIARKRAETDLRVAVARAIGRTEISVVRARFGGNPEYARQADIDAYKAGIAKGMRRLHREEPAPTEIELRVARAVVATHGTDRHRLALAMAEALERGTTPTADSIRKERADLLRELAGRTSDRDEKQERPLLRRIYGSFTGAEIREVCEGRGQALTGLPDDKTQRRVREELVSLHRDTRYPEPSPWRGLHASLSRSFGAERRQGPERGRYRGLGAEIEI
ncbi:MAG: AAA family ATPase [Boseongicola sp.]|nr:AAA family ATPase [Boseongicola sp.]